MKSKGHDAAVPLWVVVNELRISESEPSSDQSSRK